MRDRRDEVTVTMAAAVADAVAAVGREVGDSHDLLHRPFTPVCWGLPGGPARRLSLWWQYRGWAAVRRRVACRFGNHRYLPYWSDRSGHPDDAPDGLVCLDCGGP